MVLSLLKELLGIVMGGPAVGLSPGRQEVRLVGQGAPCGFCYLQSHYGMHRSPLGGVCVCVCARVCVVLQEPLTFFFFETRLLPESGHR